MRLTQFSYRAPDPLDYIQYKATNSGWIAICALDAVQSTKFQLFSVNTYMPALHVTDRPSAEHALTPQEAFSRMNDYYHEQRDLVAIWWEHPLCSHLIIWKRFDPLPASNTKMEGTRLGFERDDAETDAPAAEGLNNADTVETIIKGILSDPDFIEHLRREAEKIDPDTNKRENARWN